MSQPTSLDRQVERILDENGWPGYSIAGPDGAEAAWIVAQHAISLPSFQRRCLDLITGAVESGEAPAKRSSKRRVWTGSAPTWGFLLLMKRWNACVARRRSRETARRRSSRHANRRSGAGLERAGGEKSLSIGQASWRSRRDLNPRPPESQFHDNAHLERWLCARHQQGVIQCSPGAARLRAGPGGGVGTSAPNSPRPGRPEYIYSSVART